MPLTQVQGGMIGPTGFANLSGITFPATQVTSTDANTLDDYEEGTWTPTLNANLTASSDGSGYTKGQYIKIGQLCYLNYSLKVGTVSGSNAVTVSLPFTAAGSFSNGSGDQGMMIYTGGVDTGTLGTLAYVPTGSSIIELYQTNDNSGGAQLTNAQLATNDFLFINLCYRTAS